MYSAASEQETSSWLVKDGLKELELLLRAVLSHQSDPILVADNDGLCLEASSAAGKLLGVSRSKMIGESIDHLLQPNKVHYAAMNDVLPGRHVLVLDDDSGQKNAGAEGQDYGFLSLDSDSRIVAWYAGAERIYGYTSDEIIGQHASCLYLEDDEPLVDHQVESHLASEAWHKKKDGSRFWANSLTTAVKDQNMELEGFARVVRDFSARHRIEEALLNKRARSGQLPADSTIAGIVSGEFDRILEANDAFLNMLGYSREEFAGRSLRWADIVAPECSRSAGARP